MRTCKLRTWIRLGERLFVVIPWIVAGGELKERSRVHLFVSRMISTSKDVWELLLCANDGVTLHLRLDVLWRSSLHITMVMIIRLHRRLTSFLREETPVASCLTQRSKLTDPSIKILLCIRLRIEGLTGGLVAPARVWSEVLFRIPHFN